MANKKYIIKLLEKTAIFVAFIIAVVILVFNGYRNRKSRDINIKSRYTFAVTIDS